MALNGKAAVVTGAVMGIGKAITEILLQNGAKVTLLDKNDKAAKSVMEDLTEHYGKEKVLFQRCDMESEEEIKAALKKAADFMGGIDIMCNNAGILDETIWEKMLSINLAGTIRGTYLALEHMSKLKGGHGGVIINVASATGIGPLPSCPAYTASKHGVVGFTRAMAAASTMSGYGVRINTLCPAFVHTELFSNIPTKLGAFADLTLATQQIVERVGVLNVCDVSEAFLELVQDETKNGQAMTVFPEEAEDGRGGRGFVEFPSPRPSSSSSSTTTTTTT